MELSGPLRELLQKLIRKKIKSKEQRQELAAYLGIQVSSLSNMLYKGEGGLNLWIATMIYCYQIDLDSVINFFENYQSIHKDMSKLSKVDREWLELGNLLSAQDKQFVIRLVKMSLQLHRELYRKK